MRKTAGRKKKGSFRIEGFTVQKKSREKGNALAPSPEYPSLNIEPAGGFKA